MIDTEEVMNFIRREAYRPMTAAELQLALGVAPEDVPLFYESLLKLEKEGQLVRTRAERYGLPDKMNLVVGVVDGHPRGYGFVSSNRSGEEDLYINQLNLNGAMHGDKVVVRRLFPSRKGQRVEGEVIRILERANRTVVGTYIAERNIGFVIPLEKRLFWDVLIPRGQSAGAKNGDQVVAEITRWPEGRRGPEGKVVERLGRPGDPGIDIEVIIRKHNLPLSFPPKVLKEVGRLPKEVLPVELEGREDLRNLQMVTIDGEDAKDFDDAVSLERQPKGWRVGVHIADVSHYVKEGSAIDRTALERGCSVYLVDRVIPMLPFELSNELCSLKAGVDRLAVSVFLNLDSDGRLKDYTIMPSVIRVSQRMTYTQVSAILSGDPRLREQYSSLVEMLENMAALAVELRERRKEQGSLDFDLPEEKVELDEEGRPVNIQRERRDLSHQLIEEFMLLANRAVAEYLFNVDIPFLFRVHERPDSEKLLALQEFLLPFGLRLRGIREPHPRSLQQILHKVEGRKEEHLISRVILRSMKQARYSAENLGHFGLAMPLYTHFTSPIRRYPDLVVHRILKEVLVQGQLTAERIGRLRKVLPEVGELASKRERLAQEAERETVDLKKAEYMERHLGELYPGIISGVTSFGFFVELDNTVEGLVHISSLVDDYYHFDEKSYALIGERTKKMFRLGDRVTVRVQKVNRDERQIDFSIVE